MWTIAIYELKRLLRMKSVIGLIIVSPLVLIFILGSALGDQFQPKDATLQPVRIGVYDEDHGQISQGFAAFLNAMENKGYLKVEQYPSRDQVAADVKNGGIDLGVHIPNEFNQSILEGKQASLELMAGNDPSKNRSGLMMLQSFIDETNRMQSAAIVLGPELLGTGVAANQQTSEQYVQAGRLSKSTKPYSALQYYSSSMLVMFLLYAGLMAAMSLLKEKEAHTLTRLQSMPISSTQIIIGKLLGNGLLSTIQTAVIILVTAFGYGVQWGDSILYLILVSGLTIVASMGLAFIVAFLFKSTKTVGAVFATFIGIMTFISGGMSPTDGTFLEKMQQFTVNYWASSSFMQLMTTPDYTIVLRNLTVLGSIGIGFLLIAFWLYRKVGYHE